MYDKRDDFKIDMFNFPFMDGYVARSPYYDAYILSSTQLTKNALMLVTSTKGAILLLLTKLLKQGDRYH